MNNYITLLGADEVSRAGYVMRDAASEMSRAASSMHDAVENQRRLYDDFLARLEVILAAPELVVQGEHIDAESLLRHPLVRNDKLV